MKAKLCVSLLLAGLMGLWTTACSGGGGDTTAGGATGGAGGAGGTGGTGGGDPAAIARGEYLVDHVVYCGQCHTPVGADGKPDMTKYLAGSKNYIFKYQNMDVTVIAENITQHKE